MSRKKLEIKVRKKKLKPLTIKKRKAKVTIKKKVDPKSKRRAKLYPTTCGYCKHWHAGPILEREEGEPEERLCLKCNEARKSTQIAKPCEDIDTDWVTIPSPNREVIRDESSPLRIKRRKDNTEPEALPKFKVERRLSNED